jgi:signal transduction histidine kinase
VGLAVVERIIRRHGGEVWGTGTEGEGASIFFTLPTPEAAED